MAEEGPIITSATEAVSTIPCTICRRQFSRYACPRCNIPYCSLLCFRSEGHADCSEAFYRKELEQDAQNDSTKTVEEKRRMMELLKRFEEDSLDGSPLLLDGADEDTDDLQNRLQALDLDSASYEQLWDTLTPAERDKFLRALNDPASDLAQQLLTSPELATTHTDPWWTAPSVNELDQSADRQPLDLCKPLVATVPSSLLAQSDNILNGPLLLYNICGVCIAYAYATRHFGVLSLASIPALDPDYQACRRAISQLVPFLTDRKSKTLHASLSSVVTAIWSLFPTEHMTAPFFAVLLRDTATLLRPLQVAVLPSPSPGSLATSGTPRDLGGHPHVNALRALSDLIALYSATPPVGSLEDSPPKEKPNHIVQKLIFYMAYIVHTPGPLLRVLADEVAIRAQTVESEGSQQTIKKKGEQRPKGTVLDQPKPRIEVLE